MLKKAFAISVVLLAVHQMGPLELAECQNQAQNRLSSSCLSAQTVAAMALGVVTVDTAPRRVALAGCVAATGGLRRGL